MAEGLRLAGLATGPATDAIHRGALRVLAEAGVAVEHDGVRQRLAGVGGRATAGSDRVRFDPVEVERRILAAPKAPPLDGLPAVALQADVYQCRFLAPGAETTVAFTEPVLARYVALARHLGVEAPGLLGPPCLPEWLPPAYSPLAERILAWKYGMRPHGSVMSVGLCGPLADLAACHAAAVGGTTREVFAAVGYLVSPLRLARPECEQLVAFAHRGLPMGIGQLSTQGGSAPVTAAGTAVLTLAEQFFLHLLQSAFGEPPAFSLWSTPLTMDLREGVLCFGRPEHLQVVRIFAALAERYGCACGAHPGLTDAKRPGTEAGVQKSMAALFTALALGRSAVAGGLLGMDEICSPVQLVQDADLVDALNATLARPDLSDEACAVEEIIAAGPGGSHLGTEFTAERCRAELLRPRTWSRVTTPTWDRTRGRTDEGLAAEFVDAFDLRPLPAPVMGESEERALWGIVRAAVRTSAAR